MTFLGYILVMNLKTLKTLYMNKQCLFEKEFACDKR